MKTATINLYSFNELNKDAQEKALIDHASFLSSIPIKVENENGELVDEYMDYEREDVIENIEINEYLFFFDGELADCITYTGEHPKSGVTEFHFHGTTQII